MFQFSYKLKIVKRVEAKCERHPRYNPERDGRGGIRGGCTTYFTLFNHHQARLTPTLHTRTSWRAIPWTRTIKPRRRTSGNGSTDTRQHDSPGGQHGGPLTS